MSEEKKEQIYSEAFEEFEKSRVTDPMAKLMFDLIDGFSPDFKEEQVETSKKLMAGVDAMRSAMNEIFKTEEGRQEFIKELKKKTGNE